MNTHTKQSIHTLRALSAGVLAMTLSTCSLIAANHGLVGLRPLPRTTADHTTDHGGSWAGTPTYDAQKGNYPFVAEHIDVIKGWFDGDFKTKRVFFEYYWGLSEERDDLDPRKNQLIKTIRSTETQGCR